MFRRSTSDMIFHDRSISSLPSLFCLSNPASSHTWNISLRQDWLCFSYKAYFCYKTCTAERKKCYTIMYSVMKWLCHENWWGACAGRILRDLLRYPLGREGVYGPSVHAFLAHTKQKVSNIVGLTTLQLAFYMGYE